MATMQNIYSRSSFNKLISFDHTPLDRPYHRSYLNEPFMSLDPLSRSTITYRSLYWAIILNLKANPFFFVSLLQLLNRFEVVEMFWNFISMLEMMMVINIGWVFISDGFTIRLIMLEPRASNFWKRQIYSNPENEWACSQPLYNNG